MDEGRARELAPLQFEEATQSLLNQELTARELEGLLRHPHSSVRGAALLACLDYPTAARTRALRTVAPWALELPRGRRGT
jgi:hypothetical protein